MTDRPLTHPPGPLTNAAWRALLLARAAAERAEADRMDACADPIRAAIHRHCARVLEEVAEKAKGFAG